MDPKGSIPNFLTQKINAMNIINLLMKIYYRSKITNTEKKCRKSDLILKVV